MRYILCAICVSAVAILLVSVDAGEDEVNMMKQMCGGCIDDTGATEEDITSMGNKEVPTTKTGKCFAFCVLHQFNCLNDTGDYQHEECFNTMSMGLENETDIAALEEVSKKCVGTKSPDNDNCETAGLLLQCIHDGAEEAGIKKM